MKNIINVYDPFTCRFGTVDGGLGVIRLTNALNAIIEERGWVTANDIAEALGFPKDLIAGDLCGIPEKVGCRFMVKTVRDEEDRIEMGVLTYGKPPKD